MPYDNYDDEETQPRREYIIGLDLGQMSDYAALALLEMTDTGRDADKPEFDVTYLHRWPIGTPYPKIVEGVAKILNNPPFCHRRIGVPVHLEKVRMPTTLALDQTGAGRPVCDTFNERNLPAHLLPITITGGHKAHSEHGGWLVPKRILVSTLQVALQNKRLHIASKLPEAATLAKELQNFQLTFTENANDTYEGRKGAHDDLVLAVALALWTGSHASVRVTDEERALFQNLYAAGIL
ncbi:MAG: hypothetical protein M3R15_30825 [Acidobacteriota bacterium]|nr:hypothetical protein [Acidobacteriota bacterium]